MKRLILLVVLALAFQGAWAMDIDTAKDQGLVGEANTGLLAPVKKPPSAEVQQLIQTVNTKRKARFEQASKKTDATLAQVQARFYQLAVQKTRPGHYYQDSTGNWRKK
jgi:uncharacterized protein YdbL (DUF1318 family)